MSTSEHIRAVDTAIATKDVVALRRLARSRTGLIDKRRRRQAWPLLLFIDTSQVPRDVCTAVLDEDDVDVIHVDAERAMSWRRLGRAEAVQKLIEVLTAVFSRHSLLHYTQGFHEPCGVLLDVFEDNVALTTKAAERLAIFFLRDAMISYPIDTVVPNACISAFRTIVSKEDTDLHAAIVDIDR